MIPPNPRRGNCKVNNLMENKDIRWKQRFANFEKALFQLTRFINKGELNEFEEQGLIQAFEYTHELSWNVMKDFLTDEGIVNIFGSKSASREAFNKGIIENGEVRMEMLESRNETVHTYNEDVAEKISKKIREKYFPLFLNFENKMKTLL